MAFDATTGEVLTKNTKKIVSKVNTISTLIKTINEKVQHIADKVGVNQKGDTVYADDGTTTSAEFSMENVDNVTYEVVAGEVLEDPVTPVVTMGPTPAPGPTPTPTPTPTNPVPANPKLNYKMISEDALVKLLKAKDTNKLRKRLINFIKSESGLAITESDIMQTIKRINDKHLKDKLAFTGAKSLKNKAIYAILYYGQEFLVKYAKDIKLATANQGVITP